MSSAAFWAKWSAWRHGARGYGTFADVMEVLRVYVRRGPRGDTGHMDEARGGESRSSWSGRWRDLAVQMLPLGVVAMRFKNRSEVARRRSQMAALGLPAMLTPQEARPDFVELCAYYERLFPENAEHWRRGAEWAEAQAVGPAALMDLIERWGFTPGADGTLQVPAWWSERCVVPLEFMDYFPGRHDEVALRAAGIEPTRFHALARKAADHMWMGYYLAKGALLQGKVSLLVKEVATTALALVQRVERPRRGPLPLYVIGISEDEVAALRGPDVAVVGFNMGVSPVMEALVKSGDVRLVTALRGGQPDGSDRLLDAVTGEPVELKGGQVYVCTLNAASERMPVPDGSGVAMTNETLHHNTYADQAAMLREMHRVSLPVKGGGRAWVAGELFRVLQMPRVFVGLSSLCQSPSWDAWVSFANGIVSVETLQRRAHEWAAEGVDLHFTVVPRGLADAPALVHRVLMCPTQVLISGCAV